MAPTDVPISQNPPLPTQLLLSPEIASHLLSGSSTPNHVSNFIPLKLTKENYLMWKDITTIVLQNYEMYGMVDESEPCPPQFINTDLNPAYTKWVKKDRTCRIWLIASLSESVLPFTVGSTSARSLWLTLERRLSTLTRSHVLQLKRRIQTIQMGSLSITDYLQQIKTVADALAAAGAPLDDSDLVAHTLHGLTDDYDAFTTSIRVRSDPVTADELHGLLLSQEIEIAHRVNPTSLLQPNNNNSQAFTASTSSRPRTTNRVQNLNSRSTNFRTRYPNNAFRFTSFHNRQQTQAPLLPTPPNPLPPYPEHQLGPHPNSRPNFRPPRCQLCGLNNHRAPDCFHRYNHTYQGRLPPPRLAAMMAPTYRAQAQTPRSDAMTSHTPEDQLDSSSSLWYLDSGATNHITADLNNLSIHTPYNGPDTVTIGNGEGSSNGCGYVSRPF
ncbi:putative transcription factor interactor and regulator CCHC(Zn) family [Rosa chinensis]|uniref:Putative transcription factor interactor and regulator CCHC(Zn) family n=1 Tax=Rosa chinensis TaxID=74649 RepID=A0A2P6P504_ROSCH|nr:putative transcription factor interactor and regulator CCHC(Zn) family [Rosa chinensis]